MHFEIRPGSGAVEKTGTIKNGAKAGQPYSLRTQTAWAITSDGEIRKVELMLNREQAAYEAGIYDLDDSSFTVGGFGKLEVRSVVLKARTKPVAARVAG